MKSITTILLMVLLTACAPVVDTSDWRGARAMLEEHPKACHYYGVDTSYRLRYNIHWKEPQQKGWWEIDVACEDDTGKSWGCYNWGGDIYFTDEFSYYHELCHTLGYMDHTDLYTEQEKAMAKWIESAKCDYFKDGEKCRQEHMRKRQ